jgi:hypothetical protein
VLIVVHVIRTESLKTHHDANTHTGRWAEETTREQQASLKPEAYRRRRPQASLSQSLVDRYDRIMWFVSGVFCGVALAVAVMSYHVGQG